jgi:hypothetical protein
MSAPAAISGDFATYRHVQGRKVLQLVIEVPAESAAAVFAALGTPGAGEGIPVALARLAKPSAAPEQPAEHRRFADLPYAQQAAMRCQEPGWRLFFGAQDEGAARFHVTARCGVKSRAEIIKGTPAGDAWEALEAEVWAWQRGRR